MSAALFGVLVAGVTAHGGLQAVVAFKPSPAVSGALSHVTVRFASGGQPVDLPGFKIRIAGEMAGHAMPPLEVALASTGAAGEYQGTATFIMSGEWNLTVFADSEDDQMIGQGAILVGSAAGGPPGTATLAVAMGEPQTSSSGFSPWTIVIGAIGLTAALEAAAIGRKLVRIRRA
jgi:hypothetical protein